VIYIYRCPGYSLLLRNGNYVYLLKGKAGDTLILSKRPWCPPPFPAAIRAYNQLAIEKKREAEQ
jgi:hypothetical protein